MKWLIVQSDGEHKGQDGWTPNFYMRECYAIKHALQHNGIAADIWGLRHDNYQNKPDFESYDYILCIENYEMGWLPDFSKIKKPFKVQWIIDLHCQKWSNYDIISKNMQIILHSTKNYILDYSSIYNKSEHIWFPNGIDDRHFYNKNMQKNIDICFVGSKNENRKTFVENLEKDIRLQYFFATGSDMIDIISSSKIHFNKNIACDINYRTFETIGLGTCLLTDYNPYLLDLGFIDMYNCLIYRNYDECVNKYKYAISDDNYKIIASNSQKLVENNTYTARVRDLLKILN